MNCEEQIITSLNGFVYLTADNQALNKNIQQR